MRVVLSSFLRDDVKRASRATKFVYKTTTNPHAATTSHMHACNAEECRCVWVWFSHTGSLALDWVDLWINTRQRERRDVVRRFPQIGFVQVRELMRLIRTIKRRSTALCAGKIFPAMRPICLTLKCARAARATFVLWQMHFEFIWPNFKTTLMCMKVRGLIVCLSAWLLRRCGRRPNVASSNNWILGVTHSICTHVQIHNSYWH